MAAAAARPRHAQPNGASGVRFCCRGVVPPQAEGSSWLAAPGERLAPSALPLLRCWEQARAALLTNDEHLLLLAGGGLVVGQVEQQRVGVEEDAVGGGGHGGGNLAGSLDLAQRQEGRVLRKGKGGGRGENRSEGSPGSGCSVGHTMHEARPAGQNWHLCTPRGCRLGPLWGCWCSVSKHSRLLPLPHRLPHPPSAAPPTLCLVLTCWTAWPMSIADCASPCARMMALCLSCSAFSTCWGKEGGRELGEAGEGCAGGGPGQGHSRTQPYSGRLQTDAPVRQKASPQWWPIQCFKHSQ